MGANNNKSNPGRSGKGQTSWDVDDTEPARAAATTIAKDDKKAEAANRILTNPGATPESRQKAEQDAKEADTETRVLIEQFPDSPKVQLEGTKFALNRGDPETALTRATRVIELEPKRASGWAYAAAAYDKMGDKQKALAFAVEALKYDSHSKIARSIKNLYDGRVPLTAAVPQGPSGKPAQAPGPAKTTETSQAAPAAPQASNTAQIQAIESRRQANDFTDRAAVKLKMKDSEGAFDDVNRAINADPQNARARVLRAQVSNLRKNYTGAVSDADQVLKAEPNNVPALVERSYAQYHLGNYEDALKDATNAILLDPHNALAYYYRAQAEEKLGQAAQAKEDYAKAVSLDPALTQPSAEAKTPPKPAPSLALRWVLRGAFVLAALVLIVLGLSRAAKKTTSRPPQRIVTTDPARPKQPYATLPPKMLLGDNFRIIREVGRGGMGVVYEAEDITLQRRVAVKQLYRDRNIMMEDHDRFLTEARLVAKLKHHNVAEIHSVVDEDDLYLVFEFIEGRTLASVIDERKALSFAETAQILRGVCAAVEYAHGKNVIHRDIKPGNIMITPDGTPKVMDFGLAHQSKGVSKFSQTSAAGTQPYMAPEQHSGSVCKESDLYAVGATLYEMLTGELPFDGPDFMGQKRRVDLDGLPVKRDLGSPALEAFFKRALDPDSAKRFHTAGDLLAAFQKAAPTEAPNAQKQA